MKKICIIPAKGNSERLPNKNIIDLCGKPLIAYTIEAALRSKIFDEICVSTESKKIAKIAKRYGASIPYMRLKRLTKNKYGVADVCLDVLSHYIKKGVLFDILAILLPTSPLRDEYDIIKSFQLFCKSKADGLVSYTDIDYHPFWAMKKQRVFLQRIFPEYKNKKRHELIRAYKPTGAIHILKVDRFLRERSYNIKETVGYYMPAEKAVDIDTRLDLEFARFLLHRSGNRKK